LIVEELANMRHELSKLTFEVNRDTLLQKALDRAEALTHSQIGFFHFFDEEAKEVSLQVWSTNTLEKMCFAEGNSAHYPLEKAGVWVDCVYSRTGVIHNDYLSLPHKKGLPEGHAPLVRFITVPIIRDDKIVAIVGVGNKKFDYIQDDVHIVEKIGHIAYSLYERQSAEQKIEFMAYYDTLTKLPNRTLLSQRIDEVLEQTQKNHQMFAVCYLDLDNFKPINDLYGHHTGDELLRLLALRLSENLHEGDTLARLGGDEFVFILANIGSMHRCEIIAEDILRSVAEPFEIDKKRLYVSGSIGITIYPNDLSDSDTLLRHADHAMYQAKTRGKSSYRFYELIENENKKANQNFLEEFIHALGSNQLKLHYQPKISLKDGKVLGFEALIRWQHPTRGLLYPSDFLHIIEDTPYEITLGEWVIATGLNKLFEWHTKEIDVHLSINISPKHINDPRFADYLENILKNYPKKIAHKLEIEILEIASIQNISDTAKVMQRCSALGISFSLDDFGTGYSSLSYFHQLPISVVKIDQNFVKDMLENNNGMEIVKGVLEMATRLDRFVVAEGVETLEIGVILMGLGCQYAQGYGIARPMDEFNVEGWLEEWSGEVSWHSLHEHTIYHPNSEINIAIYSHARWLEQIENSLKDETIPFPASDYTQCQFARWYRGIGKHKYSANETFAFIQKIHYELHAIAQQIQVAHQNKDLQKNKELHEILINKSEEMRGYLSRFV
jgi:diguanylate cyclase (GGDEF)-like protein